MKKQPHKLCWYHLSSNPAAIQLISEALEQTPDKINWSGLSENPAAIHLLEQYQDKVDWDALSKNPAIFMYDYEAMRTHFRPILQGVIQNRFHPKNIKYFAGWGHIDIDDDFE